MYKEKIENKLDVLREMRNHDWGRGVAWTLQAAQMPRNNQGLGLIYLRITFKLPRTKGAHILNIALHVTEPVKSHETRNVRGEAGCRNLITG